MKVSDIKIGSVIDIDNDYFYVVEYNYISNALTTVVHTVLKNLKDNSIVETTFPLDSEVTSIDLVEISVVYSYSDDYTAYFVSVDTKDIHKVDKSRVEGIISEGNNEAPYTFVYAKDYLVSITPPTYLDLLVGSSEE